MKCAICGKEIEGWGNNPYPVRTDENARCCNDCDSKFVITTRIMTIGADPSRVKTIADRLNNKSFEELAALFA